MYEKITIPCADIRQLADGERELARATTVGTAKEPHCRVCRFFSKLTYYTLFIMRGGYKLPYSS